MTCLCLTVIINLPVHVQVYQTVLCLHTCHLHSLRLLSLLLTTGLENDTGLQRAALDVLPFRMSPNGLSSCAFTKYG